ncbi:family 16 glycosylhydrolase [candidate division KSB1 bacterium]|nr:family 16 glycosylhydrolase [candidate division KSB1 bacterium]
MSRSIIGFVILIIFCQLALFSQDYEMVWSDEFEGTELDDSKWEHMLGNGTDYGLPAGWGNNEREWYLEDNATIENGNLVITAREETHSGCDYTSSRIRTKEMGDWTYGRFEFRAKMPVGKGLWAALWLMPTDNLYGGWAASGEVDIVEFLGHETNKVHGTLHYGGSWPQNAQSTGSTTLSEGSFAEEFHEFVMEWEEGVFHWFVDSVLYQTKTSWYSTNGDFPAPFDQRFHLLINLAVGGNWPGYPDATTTFPQTLEVDYVRVYQKEGGSFVGDSEDTSPSNYLLSDNYPNPFNSHTTIQFRIPKSSHVKISVYNQSGRTIQILTDDFYPQGEFQTSWDGTDASGSAVTSGIYFYQIETDSYQEVKKALLLK